MLGSQNGLVDAQDSDKLECESTAVEVNIFVFPSIVTCAPINMFYYCCPGVHAC